MPDSIPGKPSSLPLLAAATTLVLWASAFVGIRHLGHTFSPTSLTLGRVGSGALVLGLTVLLSRSWRRPTAAQWRSMAVIGILWFGVYNVALNAGERRIDAGTAAMLIQVSPLLIAILAIVFLGERASVWLWVGMLVAFAGVAFIALSAGSGGSGSDHDLLGVLLCLSSALVYAISLVIQKQVVAVISALQVTFVACTVGFVVCLPWFGGFVHDLGRASASDVGWLVYLGVFPTAIAFTTYAYALQHMSASTLGVSTYLVPVITVLLSWWLLDETPAAAAYVGGALCLAGVGLARRRSTAARPVDPSDPGSPAGPDSPDRPDRVAA